MTSPPQRLYRLLLTLFPRRFRRSHGEQLERLFLDNWLEHRARGWGARIRFTVATVMDIVTSAVAVRLRARFRSRPPALRSQESPSGLLAGTLHDLRYATRCLLKAPGFTAAVVTILALGIGANTTMFTIVNDIFFNDPPLVQYPDELVGFSTVQEQGVASYLPFADYERYREHNRVFTAMLAYADSPGAVTAHGGAEVVRGTAWMVSGNYFDALGVEMAIGRTFLARERPAPEAIITDRLWRRLYDADPRAIGRPLAVNGRTFWVVGVAPPGFRGTDPVQPPPDIYVPLGMREFLNPMLERGGTGNGRTFYVRVLGRLRPGIDITAAQANIEALTPPDEARRVELYARFHLRPHSAQELGELFRLWALILGAVLAIAGANVAILLLARASSRRREFGVRTALGAGRGRIARQLLVESLLLSLLGGAGGLILAWWSADLAASLIPLSFSVDFAPDGRVTAFTLALVVVTTLLVGVVPAWRQSRTDVAAYLHRTDPVTGRFTFCDALVVAQLSLSMVLVVGAGLLVRSVHAARSVDLGFDPRHKLLVRVDLASHGYGEGDGLDFLDAMLRTLPALPGVAQATTTTSLPLNPTQEVGIRAAGAAVSDTAALAGFHRVGPHYFRTMEIPLLAGRDVAATDDAAAPPVVIVDDALAERVWPGERALGQTLVVSHREAIVVGVAANTSTDFGPTASPQPSVYVPQFQDYAPRVTLVVATRGEPAAATRHIERAVHAYDPALVIASMYPLQDLIDRRLLPYRLTATFASLFGALALFLATVGLYGVQSFLVARRSREIGIRLALGAVQIQVARGVIRRGLTMTACGIAIGAVVAVASAAAVEHMLFGVSAQDPLTFALVPVVLLATSALGSWMPARRASRVEPVVALQDE